MFKLYHHFEPPGVYLLQHTPLHFGFRWPTQGPGATGEGLDTVWYTSDAVHLTAPFFFGWMIECVRRLLMIAVWSLAMKFGGDENYSVFPSGQQWVKLARFQTWHCMTFQPFWGEETGMHGPWLQLAFWALGSRANGRPDQGALDPMRQLWVVMRFAAPNWICGEVGGRRKQLQTRNMQILGRSNVMKSNVSFYIDCRDSLKKCAAFCEVYCVRQCVTWIVCLLAAFAQWKALFVHAAAMQRTMPILILSQKHISLGRGSIPTWHS